MKLNKHTVYNPETERCEPAHASRTCEICNIYWSKYYDKHHLENWLKDYHNQAWEWVQKQDDLFVEVTDNG